MSRYHFDHVKILTVRIIGKRTSKSRYITIHTYFNVSWHTTYLAQDTKQKEKREAGTIGPGHLPSIWRKINLAQSDLNHSLSM